MIERRICVAAVLSLVVSPAFADDLSANTTSRLSFHGFSLVAPPAADWTRAPSDRVTQAMRNAGLDVDSVTFERRNGEYARYASTHRDTYPAMLGVQLLPGENAARLSDEEFVRAMDDDLRQMAGPGGRVVASKAQPYTFKGVPCASYKATAEGTVRAFLSTRTVTTSARGLFCRHPAKPSVVVHAAVRSTSYGDWTNIDAAGDAEADAFLDSIEFTALPAAKR
jgi:hypothetical protein